MCESSSMKLSKAMVPPFLPIPTQPHSLYFVRQCILSFDTPFNKIGLGHLYKLKRLYVSCPDNDSDFSFQIKSRRHGKMNTTCKERSIHVSFCSVIHLLNKCL